MPLFNMPGASAPKELGLFWRMQTSEGTTVEVYVYASALQSFDPDPLGPVGLLKRHRQLLEEIASAKYDRHRAPGTVHVTAEDLHATGAGGT